MMQQSLANRRLLVDRPRLHLAVYDAHASAPLWHFARNWGGRVRKGVSRPGTGFQVRAFGRVIEAIVYP